MNSTQEAPYLDSMTADSLFEPEECLPMARQCKCATCRKAIWLTFPKWKAACSNAHSSAMELRIVKPMNELSSGGSRTRSLKARKARRVAAQQLHVALARTKDNSTTRNPEAGTAGGSQWARLISAVQNAQAEKNVLAVIGVLGTVQGDVGDWFALVQRLQEKEVHPVVPMHRAQEVAARSPPAPGDKGVGFKCWVLVDEGGCTSKPQWVMEDRPQQHVPACNASIPEGSK